MKIVYAGEGRAGTSSLFRRQALERLGHEVVEFYPAKYEIRNKLMAPFAFRLAAGPHANQLNRDLLEVVQREKPDLLWADKVLLLKPQTLKKIRDLGVVSVSYMIDNAFGPRRDPGWRMYVKDIPYFDLHVTQRDVSVGHYIERGARNVMKVQTAYEPTIHFPPQVAMTDRDRDREVSFIGTPYDDRADVLTAVADAGVPVVVSGSPSYWKRALSEEAYGRIFRCGELYEKEYREAIWRSKINLSFLTHSNQDEYAHKSFEIAGCGGFLMAERSEGHALKFKEDEEAVFFSGTEELIAKIKRYLPDEAARTRIAAAGRERAARDGYYNDVQVGRIVERALTIARESGRDAG
jgi:spore maturation protein CgeB